MTRQNDTADNRHDAADDALTRRIRRKRGLTRFNMLLESLTPRLLWPACFLALYVALSWFGVFLLLPFALRIALLAVIAVGFIISLWPLRRLRLPSAHAAEQRLEAHNGLSHQAISVRLDRPAHETPEAMTLWHAHQKRMAERLRQIDSGIPKPDLAAVDPYALRTIPVLLLVVAWCYAGSNGTGRLADAFAPPAASGESAVALRLDAWISPPAYTRKAPVYLRAGGGETVGDIPEGSVLTVRLSGSGAGQEIAFTPQGGGEAQVPDLAEEGALVSSASFTLEESGRLDAAELSWDIAVIADTPPQIAFKGRPRAAANGALEIEYTLTDDYGVTRAYAEIAPAGDDDDDADAEPVYPLPEFPLNMPARSSADHSALTSRNLTEHPLSGTPVTITLVAEDAAGNAGKTPALEMVLPAKTFRNLLAGSVAEQRQIFALDTRRMPEALQYSAAITLRPEETIPDLSQFLLIKSAQTRMTLAHDEESYRDTADYMWDIATGIEDGALSEAERRLRDAQDALSQALEDGASDAEIARLMQELREAMQDYLSEMAQRMQPSQQMPGNQQALRQRDLDNLLNQLENLARSGDRDAARQLLSELQRMMNNLQPPSSMAGQQGGQQNSEMREQVDRLGELIQEQQQLMNETFDLQQQLRDRELWGDPETQPQQQGENGEKSPRDMTAEELREALKNLQDRQQALSGQLSEMQQRLSELGMPPAEGFDQAGEAMDGAAEALGEGEGSQAVEGQGNALQALRQGAQQMMNAMMAQGQGQGQQGPGGQTGWGSQAGRDPLGRNQGSDGLDFGENVEVPDEITVQRAREILDAIRERLNQQQSPLPSEPPYLERLLEPPLQD